MDNQLSLIKCLIFVTYRYLNFTVATKTVRIKASDGETDQSSTSVLATLAALAEASGPLNASNAPSKTTWTSWRLILCELTVKKKQEVLMLLVYFSSPVQHLQLTRMENFWIWSGGPFILFMFSVLFRYDCSRVGVKLVRNAWYNYDFNLRKPFHGVIVLV